MQCQDYFPDEKYLKIFSLSYYKITKGSHTQNSNISMTKRQKITRIASKHGVLHVFQRQILILLRLYRSKMGSILN